MYASGRICVGSLKTTRKVLGLSHRTMASNGTPNYDHYPFFRNCEKETVEPVNGTVKGTLPPWLEGELFRVGPGIQKIGETRYNHVFDGLAIIHKFSVKDGKAHYQSRALKSDAYKKNMEANRIVVSEFGTTSFPDPCQSIFGRMKSDFKAMTSVFFKRSDPSVVPTDNCAVNVGYYGDQLYAMTETNFVRQIDPPTLETHEKKTNIERYVAVNSATAHPQVLQDGTVINVGNSYTHAGGPHYSFIKVPPSYNSEETSFVNAEVIEEIPCRWKTHPSYFHSFGITGSNKLIFVESPLTLNLPGLAAGQFLHKSYKDWMTWYPNEKARIHIVSMDNGKSHPVTYETENLFTFHHINAYEENGEVIVDVAGYDDGEWVKHLTIQESQNHTNIFSKGSARRYVLPLNVESAKPEENLVKTKGSATAKLRKNTKNVVDLTPQHFTKGMLELPRINYKYNGKDYTFFYGLSDKRPCETYEFGMNVITKGNVKTGENISWESDGAMVSEPIFVPDISKSNPEEDDGVILAALLPKDKPKSISLLVLDAKNMTEIARADFEAQGAITGTFHGIWAQTKEKIHNY